MTAYSNSLKLTLIGDGEQTGTWGQTTNVNFGTLLEQAITGVVSIVMADADYTMSSLNGASDEARNAVLVVSGTNGSVKKVVAPLAKKLYTVVNNTVGGYAITIGASTGSYVTIPNGITTLVYCDGTDFYSGINGVYGDFTATTFYGALEGSSTSLVTTNFTVTQVGTDLVFKYNGNPVLTVYGTGDLSAAGTITGVGSVSAT